MRVLASWVHLDEAGRMHNTNTNAHCPGATTHTGISGLLWDGSFQPFIVRRWQIDFLRNHVSLAACP